MQYGQSGNLRKYLLVEYLAVVFSEANQQEPMLQKNYKLSKT